MWSPGVKSCALLVNGQALNLIAQYLLGLREQIDVLRQERKRDAADFRKAARRARRGKPA